MNPGRWRILLWRIGTPAPIQVASLKDEPGRVSLAVEPGTGKICVSWLEDGRPKLRRTDASGSAFEGPARTIRAPGDAPAFGDRDVIARDDAIDVVYQADQPGGIWIGTVAG